MALSLQGRVKLRRGSLFSTTLCINSPLHTNMAFNLIPLQDESQVVYGIVQKLPSHSLYSKECSSLPKLRKPGTAQSRGPPPGLTRASRVSPLVVVQAHLKGTQQMHNQHTRIQVRLSITAVIHSITSQGLSIGRESKHRRPRPMRAFCR